MIKKKGRMLIMGVAAAVLAAIPYPVTASPITLGESDIKSDIIIELQGDLEKLEVEHDPKYYNETSNIYTVCGAPAFKLNHNKNQLSVKQKEQISLVIAAYSNSTKSHEQYIAAQAAIWEIEANEKLGIGYIYQTIVLKNGKAVKYAYQELMEYIKIPDFLSNDCNKPKKYKMKKEGDSWKIRFTHTGGKISEDDFIIPDAFSFEVKNRTITLESDEKPEEELIEWYKSNVSGTAVIFNMLDNGKASGIRISGTRPYGCMELSGSNTIPLEIDKFEYKQPDNLSIQLTGNKEVLSDERMRYDIDATISSGQIVDNFYINICPPADTVPIRLCTGSWSSQPLHNVLIKTNHSSGYLLYGKNLSAENELDLSASTLQLEEGEKITDIMLEFESTPEGIRAVKQPCLIVRVSDVKAGNILTCTVNAVMGKRAAQDSCITQVIQLP